MKNLFAISSLLLILASCATGPEKNVNVWIPDTNKDCKLCHGAGTYDCPNCKTTKGKVACTACNQGYVACNACGGSGNTSAGICPSCSGAGKVNCTECGGTATVKCPKCKGEGYLKCGKWEERAAQPK